MPIPSVVEASCIVPNLWQGSAPPPGPALGRAGFSVIVLCAEEYQPPSASFPGTKLIVRAPNDDSDRKPTIEERTSALRAAKIVEASVRSGKRTLVTCMAGRNRSGLVTALALCRLYGCSGREAVRTIQARRRHISGEALTNPHFIALVSEMYP